MLIDAEVLSIISQARKDIEMIRKQHSDNVQNEKLMADLNSLLRKVLSRTDVDWVVFTVIVCVGKTSQAIVVFYFWTRRINTTTNHANTIIIYTTDVMLAGHSTIVQYHFHIVIYYIKVYVARYCELYMVNNDIKVAEESIVHSMHIVVSDTCIYRVKLS